MPLTIQNEHMCEMTPRTKTEGPHASCSFSSMNPLSVRRRTHSLAAWNAVGDALRKSTKSSPASSRAEDNASAFLLDMCDLWCRNLLLNLVVCEWAPLSRRLWSMLPWKSKFSPIKARVNRYLAKVVHTYTRRTRNERSLIAWLNMMKAINFNFSYDLFPIYW